MQEGVFEIHVTVDLSKTEDGSKNDTALFRLWRAVETMKATKLVLAAAETGKNLWFFRIHLL